MNTFTAADNRFLKAMKIAPGEQESLEDLPREDLIWYIRMLESGQMEDYETIERAEASAAKYRRRFLWMIALNGLLLGACVGYGIWRGL